MILYILLQNKQIITSSTFTLSRIRRDAVSPVSLAIFNAHLTFRFCAAHCKSISILLLHSLKNCNKPLANDCLRS